MPVLPTSQLYGNSLQRFTCGRSADNARLIAGETEDPYRLKDVLAILGKTVFVPLMLAGLLLLIPLRMNGKDDINPWLFCLFQTGYTIIGFPLMLFVFEFMSIEVRKQWGKWQIRVGILLCGQLLIFPFNLYTYCRGLVASGAAPLSVVHTVILKACPD